MIAYDRYALRRANQYLKRKGFHPFDRFFSFSFSFFLIFLFFFSFLFVLFC